MAIAINYLIADKYDNPIAITEQDIRKRLYLCHSHNGERMGAHWEIKFSPGDFEGRVGAENYLFENELGKDDSVIILYIKNKNKSGNEHVLISVGIDVPGVGRFDTSINGTNTPNGHDGCTFKSPKSVSIKTLPPINYGDLSNVSIYGNVWRGGDMIFKKELIDYFSLFNSNKLVFFEGETNKVDVYVKTLKIKASKKLPGHYFIKKFISRNNMSNLALDFNGCDGKNYADMIFCFNSREYHEQLPAQIIDVSVVFIDASSCRVVTSKKNRKNLQGRVNVDMELKEKIRGDMITISMIHLRCHTCVHASEPWGQLKTEGKVTYIDVYDNFGNKGRLEISISEDAKKIGGLVINEKYI
ncbi:hypothetical protein QRZ34_27685 [Klebsiella michiganensis]|uniref:hypothetical protein n=1 Tax=Klebsiella michiganensis TaxID=1134687 RepID=UPI0025709898|nr:hypothetical protein [Klebsiella michiganensis]MDL4454808.1 hypothetical protein [Klebsiella michiganensis]